MFPSQRCLYCVWPSYHTNYIFVHHGLCRFAFALFMCHFNQTTKGKYIYIFYLPHLRNYNSNNSYHFSSVAQLCPTLCDPMNRSTPGLPVHHQLPEFTQTHVHRVGDASQPSQPLSSPSPPAPTPSQHQSLFQWINSSCEVAKVLEFQL